MPCRSGQVLLPREPVPAAEAAGDLAGAMAEARVGVMAAVVAMAEAMVVVTATKQQELTALRAMAQEPGLAVMAVLLIR